MTAFPDESVLSILTSKKNETGSSLTTQRLKESN